MTGIDHLLAQHVAHLFIRDTISVFSEKVNQNDEEDTDHFEVGQISLYNGTRILSYFSDLFLFIHILLKKNSDFPSLFFRKFNNVFRITADRSSARTH